MMTDIRKTSEPDSVPLNESHALRRRRLLMLSIALLGGVCIVLIIVSALRVSASQARRESLRADFINVEAQEPGGDFSNFSHTQTHGALPCLLCHRRESSSPRPSLPGHTPCAGCHAQRFSDSRSPLCTI